MIFIIENHKPTSTIEYHHEYEDGDEFPGYEGDIHGVERVRTPDGVVFKTMCLK